jgi:hypothetical protein
VALGRLTSYLLRESLLLTKTLLLSGAVLVFSTATWAATTHGAKANHASVQAPAYHYHQPIPTTYAPGRQSPFPAGLTAPYALALGPRTAYWGPAPGQRKLGSLDLTGEGITTPYPLHCPCYIVRDEFNPKLTLGGVPGDLKTLHWFEVSVDLIRNDNASFFCCHDEIGVDDALLSAVWGASYNQMGVTGGAAQGFVRHDQADPYRIPDPGGSSPYDINSPSGAPPYIGSSPTAGDRSGDRDDQAFNFKD